MLVQESWWEYVIRTSGGAQQQDIANAIGMSAAGITAWKSGTRPRAETVIAFAHAYNRSPIEALVVAGYLHTADATSTQVVKLALAISQVDNLLAELRRSLEDIATVLDIKQIPHRTDGPVAEEEQDPRWSVLGVWA